MTDDPNVFPIATAQHVLGKGMSLRDWFAGKALNGLLAGRQNRLLRPQEYAEEAYLLAEAMLIERGKRK